MPSEQMKPVVMLDDEFEWSIPEREELLGEVRLYPRSDSITCYTDGSKNDGLSGAVYFCEYQLKRKYSNRFSRHCLPRSVEGMCGQEDLHLLR